MHYVHLRELPDQFRRAKIQNIFHRLAKMQEEDFHQPGNPNTDIMSGLLLIYKGRVDDLYSLKKH